MTRVLVIDDEPHILRALRINLSVRGYEVITASTGAGALRAAAEHKPDVVILDLGLPDMDGIEIIRGLRGWTNVPILVLSARTQEHQKVAALDAGANDYVSKPFGMDEFLARLRVLLRKPVSVQEAPVIETADFTIDLAAKRIRRQNRTDVRLTATEWQVVELLARHPGKLVTQRQLLEEVWGIRDTRTNYLRVFMVAIRRKLEPDPSHPRYFVTEPGSGLRFVPEGVRQTRVEEPQPSTDSPGG